MSRLVNHQPPWPTIDWCSITNHYPDNATLIVKWTLTDMTDPAIYCFSIFSSFLFCSGKPLISIDSYICLAPPGKSIIPSLDRSNHVTPWDFHCQIGCFSSNFRGKNSRDLWNSHLGVLRLTHCHCLPVFLSTGIQQNVPLLTSSREWLRELMAVEKATIKKDNAIKSSPTYTMEIACFGSLPLLSLLIFRSWILSLGGLFSWESPTPPRLKIQAEWIKEWRIYRGWKVGWARHHWPAMRESIFNWKRLRCFFFLKRICEFLFAEFS